MIWFALTFTTSSTAVISFGVKPFDTIEREPEVLRVVHADHRAEELVHLLRVVADVRAALAGAEQFRVAADVPDVVVPGHCPVARPDRERQIGDLAFVEVDEARRVAQRLERPLAERSWRSPELGIGEVEVVEVDVVVRSDRRHGDDCTGALGRSCTRPISVPS